MSDYNAQLTGPPRMLDCATMRLAQIVARQLRSLRARQQLSQEALAAKAGLSVSYISMLERGHRSPPLDTLEVLAGALKVAPAELLRAGRTRS
jgi:transcriptional regulator with XRE-family HTH domain